MGQPSISIIVPVYNVESYLKKCIHSIINQTFKDIEIILVDDGSTDHSGEMCEKFALEDKRIRVFHKKNGGLSDARNYGLKVARGQFIGFVDSDDYIHPDMYLILYKMMIEKQVDVSVVSMKWIYNSYDERIEPLNLINPKTISKKQALIGCLTDFHIGNNAWNKLYKKSIWDKFSFPVGKYYEDYFVMYEIINSVSKIATLDEDLYFYVQRTGSIMRSSLSLKKYNDFFEANQKMLSFFKKEYPDLLPIVSIRYFSEMLNLTFTLLLHRKDIGDFKERVIQLSNTIIENSHCLKGKKSLRVLCTNYCPDLFQYYLKWRARILFQLILLKCSFWIFYYSKISSQILKHRLFKGIDTSVNK